MQQMQERQKTTQDKPREKKARPERQPKLGVVKTGSHTPFAAAFAAEIEDDRQQKAAAKEASRKAKEEHTQKAKEAEEEAKHGSVRKFVREKQKANPDMPQNLYEQMFNAKTKGEAKRLWREHLSKTETAAV